MLEAFAVLLGFQLLGEILVQAGGLPLPGPVLGLALLFLVLAWRRRVGNDLGRTSHTLLEHLSLLFVPAGVGIVQYLPRLAHAWLPLGLALLGSTLAAIAVTALVMRVLLRLTGALQHE